MIDGTTTSSGWSNSYNKSATNVLPSVSKAHATEWVSVAWPNAQRLSSLQPFFNVSAVNPIRVLPSAVGVSWWDGAAWHAATNVNVALSPTTNTASTITFDPVSTTRLRLELTSPSPGTGAGFMQIAELQVPADQVAYNATAALAELRLNGRSVAAVDRATLAYTALSGPFPEIEAVAADNGRVAVVPPQSLPGTARIVVTSEDLQHTATYTIELTADAAGQLAELHGLVAGYGLDKGLGHDLDEKIAHAEREVAGAKKHPCEKVEELLWATLDHAGEHGLAYAEALELVRAETQVAAVLECPAGEPAQAGAVADLVRFMGLVEGMSLPRGEADGLIAKAQEAAHKIVEGPSKDDCKKLDELARKIADDTGKKNKLTDEQGAVLTAAVDPIRAGLGCSAAS